MHGNKRHCEALSFATGPNLPEKQYLVCSAKRDGSRNENAGDSPGVHHFSSELDRSSGRHGSVDLSTCFSEHSFDLWEIANSHHREDQPIDFGFHTQESRSAVALAALWRRRTLPVDRSSGGL